MLAVAVAVAGALEGGRSPASAATDRTLVAQTAATADPAPKPCAAADLALREVSVAGGTSPHGVYALRNNGAAACRISGRAGIRLFDAQGKPIPLRIAPNSATPLLLTLAPGDEASFTATYGPGAAECTASGRIEAYLAPQLVPLRAATGFAGCASPALHVSNLRLGAPTPAPSALPSPLPSVSPPTSPAFSP